MNMKQIITTTILGIIGAFLLIGLWFGAIYQQSLKECPLTTEELANE